MVINVKMKNVNSIAAKYFNFLFEIFKEFLNKKLIRNDVPENSKLIITPYEPNLSKLVVSDEDVVPSPPTPGPVKKPMPMRPSAKILFISSKA